MMKRQLNATNDFNMINFAILCDLINVTFFQACNQASYNIFKMIRHAAPYYHGWLDGLASVNEIASPFAMSQPAIFRHLKVLERLVWYHHSTTDVDWNTVSNPRMPDWPRILLTTVTFKDEGNKTKVRLVWVPLATEAEISCFTEAVNNMGNGREGGYAIMDEIFVELQAG